MFNGHFGAFFFLFNFNCGLLLSTPVNYRTKIFQTVIFK